MEILSDFAQLSVRNVNFNRTKVVWIEKMKYSQNSKKKRWKLNGKNINLKC
jgi:hypothetical protein